MSEASDPDPILSLDTPENQSPGPQLLLERCPAAPDIPDSLHV